MVHHFQNKHIYDDNSCSQTSFSWTRDLTRVHKQEIITKELILLIFNK